MRLVVSHITDKNTAAKSASNQSSSEKVQVKTLANNLGICMLKTTLIPPLRVTWV